MTRLALAILLASAPPALGQGVCFFDGAEVTAMTQVCFYHCWDGRYAITISAVDICPISISPEDFQ